MEFAGVAGSIEDFCERVRRGLGDATFDQKRKLVELLIDRVIVTSEEVEIRYVIPTDPSSEQVRFCHLRSDYLPNPLLGVASHFGYLSDRIPNRLAPHHKQVSAQHRIFRLAVEPFQPRGIRSLRISFLTHARRYATGVGIISSRSLALETDRPSLRT